MADERRHGRKVGAQDGRHDLDRRPRDVAEPILKRFECVVIDGELSYSVQPDDCGDEGDEGEHVDDEEADWDGTEC